MNEIECLTIIRNSLNSIEVKGADNLDYLLGSIRLIDTMIKAAKKSASNKAEESKTD